MRCLGYVLAGMAIACGLACAIFGYLAGLVWLADITVSAFGFSYRHAFQLTVIVYLIASVGGMFGAGACVSERTE